MNATEAPKPENQVWGIYYTDREYARTMGDPLLTVVEAPTKLAAEQLAVRLGVSEPWAHPLPAQQQTEWLARQKTQPSQSQGHPQKPHQIMQSPSTAQLRTAIEVLKKLDQRVNEEAASSVMQLPENKLGDQYAERLESKTIEQSARIKLVTAQLEGWREQLRKEQRQCVSHRV